MDFSASCLRIGANVVPEADGAAIVAIGAVDAADMSEVAFAILFGAAGTVALLTMCAWLDCCDKIVDFDLLQTREESSS